MKKYLIVIFVLISSTPLIAQTSSVLPVLSIQQMLDDFDTLYHVISSINPHDYVRRKVNGYAMLDSIKSLRKEIKNIQTTEAFYWLINRALILCQDGHTSIVRKYLYEYMADDDRHKSNSSITDTTIIKAYSKLRSDWLTNIKLSLPLKYIDGEYISLQSFSVNGIAVPQNAVLTTVNSVPVHLFVQKKLQYKKDLHWDFKHKRFYSDDFYNSFDHTLTDKITFKFEGRGKKVSLIASLSDTVHTANKLVYIQDKEIKTVEYFADKQILYIRMPVM